MRKYFAFPSLRAEGAAKHFEEYGYKIEKKYEGIYYVFGGMFPLQVIVTPELLKSDCFWLANLRNDLSKEEVSSVLDAVYLRAKDKNVKMYLDIVIRANATTFSKEIGMLSNEEMREAFRGTAWARDLVAQGRAEGEAKGMREMFSLWKSGRSLREAEQMLNGKA